MSSLLKISHPETLLFAQWQAPGSTDESGGRILSWQGPVMESPGLLACVGTFDTIRSFNSIKLKFHSHLKEFLPNTFRFEISNDGVVWEPILHEANFHGSWMDEAIWHFSLISARMIKFLFLVDRQDSSGHYLAAFGEFAVMVSGIVQVDVSSELDRLWVKDNLVDQRKDYGWSSALRLKKQPEFIHLDLGSINRVGEIRLLSKNDRETFFPEAFRLSYSEDNITYHHLIEETGFMAEPGTWYKWRFLPTNIRFLRIDITEGAKTREGKYVSQIIEVELYAVPDLVDKTEKSLPEPIPYASVLRSGIMRFAVDGEVKEGVAVQASDRRLRDSTTEARGIVELASDGEDSPGVAVQGSDRRLKYATEDLPGIVRLARDGETRTGHAVQGSDRRLRLASEEEAGLVELAADGENRPGVVVQGSDSRLRYATEKAHGIVKLAAIGASNPGESVQANDPRLRDATEEAKGIVRLARSGEAAGDAAVQGDDPRLRAASTENLGIVELARDGEVKEGAVVQSHDKRLHPATESSPGIMEFCAPGNSIAGRAVQGHDPRLSDARDPKPHNHDYAPRVHNHSDHEGSLHIRVEGGTAIKKIVSPPPSNAPVTGQSTGAGSGILGIGERDGVAGAGKSAGVLGLGLTQGAGVIGAAQNGSGGWFVSERGYGLVAGGMAASHDIHSSPYALLSRGLSGFLDSMVVANPELEACIAVYFPVESGDVISPGDLVSSGKPGHVKKCKTAQDTAVVGVVVNRAAVVLGAPGNYLPDPAKPDGFSDPQAPKGHVLVAVSGIVSIRTVAQSGIRPGDLLVASSQAGKAEKWQSDKAKPGSLVARSLEELSKGEGLLRCLLVSG
ncbi:MAG TPA: discoidin domain-containing protein [Leptospiraceae bacterium]|nr:discoidin domain-containing protein [Leptospiraceae bacterium]